MNSYTDLEKLELYAQQIHDSGIDITPDQKNEWTMIAYACASQGEAGASRTTSFVVITLVTAVRNATAISPTA